MDKAFPPEKYTSEPLSWHAVRIVDIPAEPNTVYQDWALCEAPAAGRSEVCNMTAEADVVPLVNDDV